MRPTQHLLRRPRALLIDGNSVLYGAYYGTPPLHSTHDNDTNVNGVYTLLRTVRNHIATEQVHHAAVCWDRPEPTFRHRLMPSYKAQRSSTPDDLRPQFNLAKEALAALGVPQFERAGFEADDLLATLSHALQQEGTPGGVDVRLVSADKDLLQLVRPGVVDLIHPFSSTKGVRGHDQVLEDWGVEPDQLPVLFALMGDAADNVKGVTGIGKKIGGRLLNEYRTMEGILAAAAAVPTTHRSNTTRGLHLMRAFVKKMKDTPEEGLSGNEVNVEKGLLSPEEYLQLLETMHRMRTDVGNVLRVGGEGEREGGEEGVLEQLRVVDTGRAFQTFVDKHGFHSIAPLGAATSRTSLGASGALGVGSTPVRAVEAEVPLNAVTFNNMEDKEDALEDEILLE
jgi:5'-3' exonuclease